MKQAVLGYEQKFFVNGTQISGVQSINGSYAIQERPINVLGWGHVNAGFYETADHVLQEPGACHFILSEEGGFHVIQEDSCLQNDYPSTPNLSVLNAPLEGTFSINSVLVSEDFFLSFTGDNPFSGSIHHDSQYFGFYSGYISSHSVTCSVGQIPTTSTNVQIYGDLGGSPDYILQEEADEPWEAGTEVILQEDEYPLTTEDYMKSTMTKDGEIKTAESLGQRNLNASGSNPFPAIRVPNQGSMSVECAGASTDRVTSFTQTINVPLSPIYIVGSATAVQVDVTWPMTITSTFTLEIDRYKYNRLRKYLKSPTVEDIAIKINDCFGNKIQNYEIKNAKLLGESLSQSVGGRLTVNLQYQSYHNKRGLCYPTDKYGNRKWI